MEQFDSRRGLVALGRIDRDRLAAAVRTITDRYPSSPLNAPAAGLAMLRIQESVNGDPFNLGEIPLSTAAVQLLITEGHTVSGAACVMADDAELATILAVADAALTHRIQGSEGLLELVSEGMQVLQEEQDVRQSILHRSKVRFALLNEENS